MKKGEKVSIALSKKTIIIISVIVFICLVIVAFYLGTKSSFGDKIIDKIKDSVGQVKGSEEGSSIVGDGASPTSTGSDSGSGGSGGSTGENGETQGDETDNGEEDEGDEWEGPILNCLDACNSEGHDKGKDGLGGAGACFAYETFVQKDGFDCCCWDEFECEKTDGMNFAMKGTCTDTRTLTDNCMDGDGDMLTEYFCTDEAQSWCSEVIHPCETDEATCYDGRCIVDNLDTDGDGATDLDEYRDGTDPNDPEDFSDICDGVDSDNTHLDAIASYQVRGTCTDPEGDSIDYCETGWLVEYWCGDAGGCGSDEATPCDALVGGSAYCMDGRCVLATPEDCSGLCALAEMGYTSGGFCGNPEEIAPGASCIGSEGESGVYLFSAEADMTCNGEELPFNSCCCFIEF
jgi:hypothetical protein